VEYSPALLSLALFRTEVVSFRVHEHDSVVNDRWEL